MSSLYKQKGSPYYKWSAHYKGRRYVKSTKMSRRDLAKKIADQWNLNLMLGDLDFLDLPQHMNKDIKVYFMEYQKFIEKRKSPNTQENNRTVLKKLQLFLDKIGVKQIDEITVKVLDNFVDSLKTSSKTKKNYVGMISLMLDQAIKESLIKDNPCRFVTLPRIIHEVKHRLLTPVDLDIIFQQAGQYKLYYEFLYHTGLRAGDVALLKGKNIDRESKAITSFIRKSRRIHELPIAEALLKQIPTTLGKDTPIFPRLYARTEKQLNNKLKYPRLYMQSILRLNNREKATLHSFRVTFNNVLRDLGLAIGDRQILMQHASSETTKIYTHPNFDLASWYVNQLPNYCQNSKEKVRV